MLKFSLPTRWLSLNPIAQAELVHQQRQPQGRRWLLRGHRFIRWVMLYIGLILFGGVFVAALLQTSPEPVINNLGILAPIFLFYTLILHFVLMLQTLLLSSNSLVREKQFGNWEMLILTGVDARQIVRGKWLATVQHQLPAYVMLGLLRAAAVVYWGASTSEIGYGTAYTYGVTSLRDIPPLPPHILLAGGIVFIFTLANLFFTAAYGVMTSTEGRQGLLAFVRAVLTRPMVIVVLLLAIGLSRNIFVSLLRIQQFPDWFEYLFLTTFNALLDNGVNVVRALVSTRYMTRSGYALNNYFQDEPNFVLLPIIASLIALGLYALLTRWALNFAQHRAIRAGALPPLPKPRV